MTKYLLFFHHILQHFEMALAPQFSGHRLGSALAPHTLEFYLDYVVSPSVDAYHAKMMSNHSIVPFLC